MIRLNLLPAKVRLAELLRLAVLGGVVVYLGAVGFLGWRFALAKQDLAQVNRKIAKVDAELKPLEKIAEEVKKLTDEQTEQSVKRSKLEELAKRQAYWVRALDTVPDLLQGGQVWLTSLDQLDSKGGIRRIVLEGNAQSVEAWADFYDNLESQNQVTELKIEGEPSIWPSSALGVRKWYHFKVSFQLKDA